MAEQAQIIRWEEPPPARGNARPVNRGVSKYDQVAAELMTRPGKSAVLYDGWSRGSADTLATRIRRGEITSFPPGDFEAVVRTVNYRCLVYASYVGPEEESNA